MGEKLCRYIDHEYLCEKEDLEAEITDLRAALAEAQAEVARRQSSYEQHIDALRADLAESYQKEWDGGD